MALPVPLLHLTRAVAPQGLGYTLAGIDVGACCRADESGKPPPPAGPPPGAGAAEVLASVVSGDRAALSV